MIKSAWAKNETGDLEVEEEETPSIITQIIKFYFISYFWTFLNISDF